jgi:hypothetical protein
MQAAQNITRFRLLAVENAENLRLLLAYWHRRLTAEPISSNCLSGVPATGAWSISHHAGHEASIC